MTFRLILALLTLTSAFAKADVYAGLSFGDDRSTVMRKLQSSDLIDQTVDSTFLARTGLNGVFKCKHKLAGLTYHLYFDWNENGKLSEITLRSEELASDAYGKSIKAAWEEANRLFTQVYGKPEQNAHYPDAADFAQSPILITHLWRKGQRQSILMGPGLEKNRSFLAIRYVNRKIEPVRTP